MRGPEPARTRRLSRVAIVGCGHRFKTLIEPALNNMGVHAVLIVDPDSSARSRAAGRLGKGTAVAARAITAELLLETSPEAVIIASPTGLHHEHVDLALRCGLPTFVEKPAASTAIAVQELRDRGRDLLVAAEQRRYRRDLQFVRSSIEMGGLGEIERIVYRDFVAPRPGFGMTWRNDPALAGGGVLLDLGYHTFGAIQWLTAATTAGFAVTSARLFTADMHVETRAYARGTWGDIEIEVDIGLDATHPHEDLTIIGSRGRMRLMRDRAAGTGSIVNLRGPGARESRLRTAVGTQYDSKSLRHFIKARPDVRTLASHAVTSQLIDDIYLCAGRPTSKEF